MQQRLNVSGPFIRRPVATTLMIAAIFLLGVFAFPMLPVAALPEAEFPTIMVTANLPGASPETMASAVATPLETQFSAVPGVTEMTSTSALGSTNIVLQFDLKKSIDTAAQEVQAAINGAAGRLPTDLPNLPTWRKVNPADSPILVMTVQSDLMPLNKLSDFAETRLARQISQIQGVAEVRIAGQLKPAIRIQLRPDKLAAFGLTMENVRSAVNTASLNLAKGTVFGQQRTTTIRTNDQLFDPAAYADIILATRNGAPVRVRDVGSATEGGEDRYVSSWQNGKSGLLIIVTRQPGANIVDTVDRVKAELPAIQQTIPSSIQVGILSDRTATIRASLHEVEITLGITVALVIIIMGFFLRDLVATIAVGVTLVVAVVATFAAMYVLGFSLNNLSLVALVISVGFVVDDAIVVVENIHRLIEEGMKPFQAALEGAAQIGFTIVSISFSLIAAFIPLLFMGGVVGRLFREFAVTVAVAILISVVVSLTLAPMISARYMRARHRAENSGGMAHRITAHYTQSLDWVLGHQRPMRWLFLVTLAIAVGSYILIPKGFFPLQDTGFVQGSTEAAQDISFDAMVKKQHQVTDILAADPAVDAYGASVGATGGGQLLNNGRIFISLKPRGDRDVSASEFIDRVRPKLAEIPGIVTYLRAGQDINLGGRAARTQYQYVLKGPDSPTLTEWSNKLVDRLKKMPQLKDVSSDEQLGAAILDIKIDREAAARFGITTSDIDQALYNGFGQRQISEYQTQTNQYRIILELDPSAERSPRTLNYFYLHSPLTGGMVPLSALATVAPPTAGPLSITHDGMFPAVNISFNLKEGVALGDAVTLVHQAEQDVGLPATVTGAFAGSAAAFRDSVSSQPVLMLAALLAVYIILGILYESFVHPLTILSTLPSAGIGAVLALWLAGMDFTIMALIGIILLIGIVKKNGILLVDFAIEAQRDHGMTPHDAIRAAALVRFRPILMTTIAALLGAIPLTLGLGTGSELRQPLGIAVVGGLLVSQMLTLYTTPVIYLTLERWFHSKRKGEGSTGLESSPEETSYPAESYEEAGHETDPNHRR